MISGLRNRIKSKNFQKQLQKKGCHIHKSVIFKEMDNIHIGCDVSLGEGTRLLVWSHYTSGKKPQTLDPDLTIGDRVHGSRNLTIQCAGKILIEDDVLIASDVFIIDYNHGTDPRSDNYLDNDLDASTVSIRRGAWIGNGVTILPGVTIGKKSIIGAGSVVTKSVPDYCIAAGNPARVLKVWNERDAGWAYAEKTN